MSKKMPESGNRKEAKEASILSPLFCYLRICFTYQIGMKSAHDHAQILACFLPMTNNDKVFQFIIVLGYLSLCTISHILIIFVTGQGFLLAISTM